MLRIVSLPSRGGKMIEKIKAEDVMKKPSIELSPADSAHEIRSVMDERKICHLPVTACGGLIGIVSRHDATAAGYHGGPGLLTAADIIKPSSFWVYPDTPLSDVAFAMFKKKYDCLPVVTKRDEFLGLIHMHDILGVVLSEYEIKCAA